MIEQLLDLVEPVFRKLGYAPRWTPTQILIQGKSLILDSTMKLSKMTLPEYIVKDIKYLLRQNFRTKQEATNANAHISSLVEEFLDGKFEIRKFIYDIRIPMLFMSEENYFKTQENIDFLDDTWGTEINAWVNDQLSSLMLETKNEIQAEKEFAAATAQHTLVGGPIGES